MSTKLFVGSLPWSVDDTELKNTFSKHGTVISAKVIMDRETGRSKGFGFVEMGDPSEAKTAIKELHESSVKGRNIVVNEAKGR